MAEFLTTQFWFAVGSIIMIDILLGGDNAVVIALACRKLSAAQRTKGILLGTLGAIALRIVLIFFALELLRIPFLKIIGAALLVYIGIKLLAPDPEGEHEEVAASDKLWGAVKTVILADLVMSIDNVIAIAGAAQSAHADHHMLLVVFGLLVSIPIIVWGSQLVLKVMDRFPVIVTLGGMLLGWIAGSMALGDHFVLENVLSPDWRHSASDVSGVHDEAIAPVRYAAGVVGALVVLVLGKLVARRRVVPETPRGGRGFRPPERQRPVSSLDRAARPMHACVGRTRPGRAALPYVPVFPARPSAWNGGLPRA